LLANYGNGESRLVQRLHTLFEESAQVRAVFDKVRQLSTGQTAEPQRQPRAPIP
jgi:hypothetical protein